MPGKRGLHFHVSIHPRGGTDDQVAILAQQYVSATERGIVVSEQSDDGSRHIHFAYELKQTSVPQDQKARLSRLYKAYLENPNGDWGAAAIKVTCHDDFYQLIGGYLAKDSTKIIHYSHNLEAAKIGQGKKDYDESVRQSKIKRTSKAAIPALVAEYYRRNHNLHDVYEGTEILTTWFDYQPKQQLDLILRQMIDDGYHHLIFDFTDRNKEVLLRYWANIIKIEPKKIPTNSINNEGDDSSKGC